MICRSNCNAFQSNAPWLCGLGLRSFPSPKEHLQRQHTQYPRCRQFASDMSQKPRIDLITSIKSPTVKKIQSLLTKRKKRVELNQTVVEGPRMIFDLLDNPKTESLVRQVIVSTDRPEWTQNLVSRQLRQTSSSLSQESFVLCEGTPQVLVALSDTSTPQGLVATVDIPRASSELDKPFRSSSSSSSSSSTPLQPHVHQQQQQQQHIHPRAPLLYLVLDGVSDPGNLGTLLRSSLAVGVAGVILLPGCCDVWNPKAVRSAMGTSFLLPLISVDSWDEAKRVMTQWGVSSMMEFVYAATMEGSQEGVQSIPYYNVQWCKDTTAASGLIIGSEGNGLSDEVRNAVACGAIRAVHVPMEAGIESLNAAVCGSVLLFEYLRQCRTMTEKA